MKISFKNDYSEGCHPKILEKLIETNLKQQIGYGLDEYCLQAEKIIQEKINNPDAKVYFVSGGTQANLIVISSILKSHESVISAETGHIFTNETGAIEATGHKIHAILTQDGKITIEGIQNVLNSHTNVPHQLKQKLVYISNSTELGTIYNKKELEKIYQFCQEKNLFLFIDGARLGRALSSADCDLTLESISKLCDVFYLGGTKIGALLGEAIVITNPKLQEDFGFHIKQRGAMLAKGRLIGIQFLTLLENDLYFDLARKANTDAMKMKAAFQSIGCTFLTDSTTNQIFPILENDKIEVLSKDFDFYVWKKIDSRYSAIRVITSWATQEGDVNTFCSAIKSLYK